MSLGLDKTRALGRALLERMRSSRAIDRAGVFGKALLEWLRASGVFDKTKAFRRALDRALDRLPFARSCLALALLASILGFFSVFSGPSYPSALLFGLIVPSVVAVSTALLPVNGAAPEAAFALRLKRALSLGLAFSIPLCLHALRAGWCAPLHDLTLLILGPFIGLLMAATWGNGVALLVRLRFGATAKRSLFWLLALAGPIGSILYGLVAFYRSPMVYAFDPFVGYFAGSPYDTGFDPTLRLLTYRVGSAGTLLAVLALVRHLEFDANDIPMLRARIDRTFVFLGLLGLGLSIVITSNGVALGHRSTTASVREALGQTKQWGRCEVVFGPRQKQAAIDRLGKDCDAWLSRLERRLGAKRLDGVTAYVFDGPAQKELLMGAAHTQIAKPWRREIYLNGATYPDDVVGHELAHVVAGQVSRGPFAVAGSWWGLLPNPGLIEGLAVALAPDEDGDLTPQQWARALRDLGKLPPMESLFSLSFFEHSGPLAYTVAGAFVEFIGLRYGKPAVRAWYRGQSLPEVTKSNWPELEVQFRAQLDGVSLPKDAVEAASARFARGSVFTRRCPHAVDRAMEQAEHRLNQGDTQDACRLFEQATALDPAEVRARFGIAECSRRGKQTTRAVEVYQSIAKDSNLPTPTRERAEELLADLRLENSDAKGAQSIYAELARSTLDADRRRSLELKASADSPEAVRALTSLLIGTNGEKAWDLAVRELLAWSQAAPQSGIADYLLGRNFWQQGREAAGVEHLERALSRAISLPAVQAEAVRLRAVMACALGERAKATSLADQLEHSTQLPTPRRLGVLRLVERCAGRHLGDDWPETLEQAQAANSPVAATNQPKQPAAEAPANAAGTAKHSPNPTSKQAWDSTEFSCPPTMARIPGTTFWMGSKPGTNSPDESPRFQTRVAGFCLDLTEVTVVAYDDCVRAGRCTSAKHQTSTCNGNHDDRPDHPINCVTYEQADAFCKQRDSRLPTEIEWEFAARGGAQALKYPWGEGSPDGRACWKNPMSCPVKSFAAGAFGLFDMTGNVWEWTSSDYAPYPFPPRPFEAHQKVYRGGSWSRRFEKWMHVGLRNRWNTRENGAHLGFRCAKSVDSLACPFEQADDGQCLAGVLTANCPSDETWNGQRCATPRAPLCEDGQHAEPGHGCVRDIPWVIKDHAPDTASVKRKRSPEFDSDCRENQPKRPQAYRYFGGEHEARNIVARQAGCKNRDVGAGWNSTCCP